MIKSVAQLISIMRDTATEMQIEQLNISHINIRDWADALERLTIAKENQSLDKPTGIVCDREIDSLVVFSLEDNVSRCTDNNCFQSHECLRYLLRSQLGDRTPVMYTFRDDLNDDDHCKHQLTACKGTWIRWRGGNTPVHEETVVEVKLESQENTKTDIAKHFSWTHDSETYYYNIERFRVIAK